MALYNKLQNSINVQRVNENYFDPAKTKGDIYASSLGYSMIKIVSNSDANTDSTVAGTVVMGALLDDVQYSVESEWEPIEYPKIFSLGFVSSVVEKLGGGEMGAYFRSKKVWKKSGYLKLSPKFRAIDVNGDGYPKRVVEALLMMCISAGGRDLGNLVGNTNFGDTIESTLTKGVGFLFGVNGGAETTIPKKDSSDEASKNETDIWGNTSQMLGQKAIDTYTTGISDYFKVRYSPPTLSVSIGKVFSHTDMVLTSISFNYSREFTNEGPLYVDLSLELSSRSIIDDVNATGLFGGGYNYVTEISEDLNITSNIPLESEVYGNSNNQNTGTDADNTNVIYTDN